MTILEEALAETRARRALPQPVEARRLREATGLTQQQVGDAVGVDRATVCRWETGKRRPRGPAARIYLVVLDRLRSEESKSLVA